MVHGQQQDKPFIVGLNQPASEEGTPFDIESNASFLRSQTL
jgi:hypothetical protein